jgi:cysteine synthase A
MGPGFVSPNLYRELLDDVELIDVETAKAECRRLAREEGILVGQSSGASQVAAKRVARRLIADRGVDATPPGPDNDVGILDADEPAREPIPASCPLVATVCLGLRRAVPVDGDVRAGVTGDGAFILCCFGV